MPKKARQGKHGNHPTILSRWYEQEDYPKSLAEHNIGEGHDCTATRVERLQNAKHWILRLNADGPQKPLRQRPEFAVALKQCLKMQDFHLAENAAISETDTSEHQQRQREDQQFETSITMSIFKLDGGTTESHGGRRQRLHLQHRSGKTHNGKRVEAHGIPHHLIHGGDFGFLEEIPEHRRVV